MLTQYLVRSGGTAGGIFWQSYAGYHRAGETKATELSSLALLGHTALGGSLGHVLCCPVLFVFFAKARLDKRQLSDVLLYLSDGT